MSAEEWRTKIDVPVDATDAEEAEIVQAALDKKFDSDLDDLLGPLDKL